MRWPIAAACCVLAAGCASIPTTPQNVCKRSGLAMGSPEYKDCVSRTLHQRRAEFWATQGQDLAVGTAVVAGAIVATQGGAPLPPPGHGQAPLSSSTLSGYQRVCRYLTPSGMVTLTLTGTCPATYAY